MPRCPDRHRRGVPGRAAGRRARPAPRSVSGWPAVSCRSSPGRGQVALHMGDGSSQVQGFGQARLRSTTPCRPPPGPLAVRRRATARAPRPASRRRCWDRWRGRPRWPRARSCSSQISGCPGLHQQQLIADPGGQSGLGKTRLVEKLALLRLPDDGLGHRHDDLRAVDAQAQRFLECDLRSHEVAAVQKCLAQQHMHRQHVLVDLQRVLELDDRPGRSSFS